MILGGTMSGNWLLQHQGRDLRCTVDELKAMWRDGRVGADDLVFHPVHERWMYLRQLDELGAPPASMALARPREAAILPSQPHNDVAVAGFTLGVLAVVPFFGALCAMVGLPLSLRGLRRAALLGGTDRRFAVAGLVLSLASLVIHGALSLLAAID